MNTTRPLKAVRCEAFAEKRVDRGNPAFAGLVKRQIVPVAGHFQFGIAAAGLVTVAAADAVVYFILRGGGGG